MSEVVLVALIAAVPSFLAASATTIMAVATWRTNRHVQTSNGKKLGELVEDIAHDLVAHTAQDQANFAALFAQAAFNERLSKGRDQEP